MKHITLALIATLSLANASSLSKIPSTNSLIVYNSNVGLVHEIRSLSLHKNDSQIVYEGVASSINTDSVNVDLPKGISLYSQQYRYDKLTQKKLLDAHLGKKVSYDNTKVTLLSSSSSTCLVKTSKNKIISVKAQEIVFDSIPQTLLTKPSLVWNVNARKDIKSEMKLDYMINNISWSSNYILNLKKNKADLSGWININNNSGKAFKDTDLYVLAGDVNRVRNHDVYPEARYVKAMMADSPRVEEKAHEGYHFYTIPFKVNLADKEKTQIKFVNQKGLEIEREYNAMLSNPLYLRGETQSAVVQYISLKGLDIPLPKGVVRTYSKLKNTSILLGESRLNHTPKNTNIKLKLGKNFDLKVTQTIKKRNDYKYRFNATVNYALKNSSDMMKIVELQVPFYQGNDAEIQTKQKYSVKRGNLITFEVKVKANATRTFDVYYESKK